MHRRYSETLKRIQKLKFKDYSLETFIYVIKNYKIKVNNLIT